MERVKDPMRQYQGRVNRAQGVPFEEIIKISCEAYEQQGLAKIEKTPEPFKVTQSLGNGKFIGNFASTAQPDWKGVLRDGRAIVIETKHTATVRLNQDKVTKEQRASLDEYTAMGAVTGVLISFHGRGFFYIPWHIWKDMKAIYGRKYIQPKDIPEYEARFDGRMVHFLPLALKGD